MIRICSSRRRRCSRAGGPGVTRNARVVIDACKPWTRRDSFPIVARTSKELEEKIRAKWSKFLPPGT